MANIRNKLQLYTPGLHQIKRLDPITKKLGVHSSDYWNTRLTQAYKQPAVPNVAHTPALGTPPGTTPTPAGTPPPPPAHPPALQPQTMPWDTQYENDVASAHRRVADTEAMIGQQRANLGSTFGYAYNDQTGAVTLDPSNPFSRAQALQKSYDENKARSTNSYAARGQLYAGSLQNAQNANQYGFQQGEDQLKRSFTSAVQGLLQRRLEAKQAEQDAINAAAAGRLDRAAASRANAEEVPGTGGPDEQHPPAAHPAPAKAAPAKTVKPQKGVTLAKGQKAVEGALVYYKGKLGRMRADGSWHAR